MNMSLKRIDHVHVHVMNRAAAEKWYADVLGLQRVAELDQWATADGPLMVADDHQAVRLSLFERSTSGSHATIAFAVDAAGLIAWQTHLEVCLSSPPRLEDHQLSWSLYFSDPDGNPFEITTYDYEEVARQLSR